jgi:hypothetical protein
MQSFSMQTGGLLQLRLDADPWNSLIEFDANVAVNLGGTLDLEFADGTDMASQVGRTFDLFDWSAVAPQGGFTIVSPYTWDVSQLYTTGEVKLMAVPEPGGGYLAMLGLVGLSICRCRRRGG